MDIVFLKPRVGHQGGLEKYTRQLLGAFVKQGCRVTLLTTGSPVPIDGVRTISLGKVSKLIPFYQLRHFDHLCQKWLQKNPQDIVFGMERTTQQTHYRAGSGVHAVYLHRRKMVDPVWKQWTHRINPLHQTLLNMEKEAFESPDLKLLFTNSCMIREEILSLYKTPMEKIKVVHNGVEWEEWRPHFEQSILHLVHQEAKRPFHFLFIGNGYLRKGLSFLLQGMAQIQEKKFLLTVVGKERNPTYFITLTQQLGLKEKVRFLGPQKNMIPFYQEADALALPSIYDPFANVTVEALAMGLFVVTSQFNGGKEILTHDTGTLIDDLLSPRSIAQSLEIALTHPKQAEQALKIRNSIKELDFSIQLDKIVKATLKTC